MQMEQTIYLAGDYSVASELETDSHSGNNMKVMAVVADASALGQGDNLVTKAGLAQQVTTPADRRHSNLKRREIE
jgi:hypothetical protein